MNVYIIFYHTEIPKYKSDFEMPNEIQYENDYSFIANNQYSESYEYN